jgi:mycothiol synthase
MDNIPFPPSEFSIRHASWKDLQSIVDFLNETDAYDFGKRNFSADGLAMDWKQAGFLENSTRLVFNEAEEIVGYGEAFHQGNPPLKTIVFGRTHPGYRGQGIGTYFLVWGERFALTGIEKCPDSARIFLSALTVESIEPARKLFEGFGMQPVRMYFRMRMDLRHWDQAPAFPAQITIHPYRHDEDLIPLHHAYEDAFENNWGHPPQSVQQGTKNIRGWVENNPGFDESLFLVAWDGDEIAGFVLALDGQGDPDHAEIWELGVRPRWQKRGLGKALVKQCFQVLKDRGNQSVILDADADPQEGPVAFYEKTGMHVETQRLQYEKTLREAPEDVNP